MTDARHEDLVRRSFRRQVDQFGPDSPFAARDGAAAWLEPLHPELVALEVACGAAHLTGAIAPRVRHVVGLDLTVELLELGAARLADADIANVLLESGNAEALPFVGRPFDLVFCRSSLHHMLDPGRAVAEMIRVCRPGGRVAISELVAPAEVDRERFDDLHRRLDPSHVATFTADELAELLPREVDVRVAAPTISRLPLTIAITPQSDAEPVRQALLDELRGGPATGFEPEDDGDRLTVVFTTATVVGTVV
jgi:ubiquinone/menaquinone biosynthesis C-methylase UbiE